MTAIDFSMVAITFLIVGLCLGFGVFKHLLVKYTNRITVLETEVANEVSRRHLAEVEITTVRKALANNADWTQWLPGKGWLW